MVNLLYPMITNQRANLLGKIQWEQNILQHIKGGKWFNYWIYLPIGWVSDVEKEAKSIKKGGKLKDSL